MEAMISYRMKQRPALLVFILFLFLSGLWACRQETDPVVLQKHLEAYPDINKKYLYQSVIRLANVKNDPDFDKLIRDVRKITIYMPPSGDTTYQIKEVKTHIRTGGYEELMSVRTANGDQVSLWVNEILSKPHYLALLDTPADDYILEIDGQIDLEYISAINVADENALKGLLN